MIKGTFLREFGVHAWMSSTQAPVPLPSKRWSCESLLRGQSYMSKQKFQLDESLSVEEKLEVAWML